MNHVPGGLTQTKASIRVDGSATGLEPIPAPFKLHQDPQIFLTEATPDLEVSTINLAGNISEDSNALARIRV